MAKKNVKAEAIDNADGSPDEVTVVPAPLRITLQEHAEALIKTEYKIQSGIPFVLVTEDRNVFYPEHASSGVNHAMKNKLKSFRVQCQD